MENLAWLSLADNADAQQDFLPVLVPGCSGYIKHFKKRDVNSGVLPVTELQNRSRTVNAASWVSLLGKRCQNVCLGKERKNTTDCLMNIYVYIKPTWRFSQIIGGYCGQVGGQRVIPL